MLQSNESLDQVNFEMLTPLSVLGYCLELLFQWKARHSSVNSISNQLLKPSLVSSADGLAFWKLWQVRSLQNEITSRYSRALQRAKADRPWISPVANHNWSSLLRSLVPCADVLHTPNPHIQHLKIRGMGTKHCKPIAKICKVVLVWWLWWVIFCTSESPNILYFTCPTAIRN